MIQIRSALNDLATQIFVQEAGAHTTHIPPESDVSSAFNKLRLHLTKFFGAAGYRALIGRAFALAKAETPGLGIVCVNTDGSLEMPEIPCSDGSAGAGTAVLAKVLGLLVTFVGEALMLKLVHGIWPGVALRLSVKSLTADTEVTR